MGKSQSVLEKRNYKIVKEDSRGVIAESKEGNEYVVKEIDLSNLDAEYLCLTIETLKTIDHPHIVSYQKSFQEENCFYIVTDHCLGGNLSEKIKVQGESREPFSEEQVMDWIVKLCMALKKVHDMDILHRDIRPQNIFLTKFGTICLGEFGKVTERTKLGSSKDENLNYLAPEVLEGQTSDTSDTYDTKSDIWSLGCVLFELCRLECAFTAGSTIGLIQKILGGPSPCLPEIFSQELQNLLTKILQKDPTQRPAAGDILKEPFVISFLTKKSKTTVEELQTSLEKLKILADGLEKVNYNTTVGSLTGGVIGAAGGITSIVGLILAPFTLGASLIVTGVGVGVAVAGGATASISNITNMVNQSTDRQNIKNIMKEFQEKMNSVVACLQIVSEGLEALKQSGSGDKDELFNSAEQELKVGAGLRAGKGLVGITELIRLVQVTNIGRVAAQAARAIRVAEVATGILSGFFVAVDVFFIAMDAREIHNIKKAREVPGEVTGDTNGSQSNAGEPKDQVKSETMKFVMKIREITEELQQSVDELRKVISFIPMLDE